ncbi:MAG: hypothetical protein HXX14_09570 [Bacteroidetes bacterium]|nr:hypothetical protein [Bacteroidota bacterium]
MKDKIYSTLSGRGLANLLKDFSKGCISENIEAKAEIKPLSKTISGSAGLLKEINNKNR